jgi:hypothetical protein
MLDVSQQTVVCIYSNTPLIQALVGYDPQFKTHSAWLVTLELGILQKPLIDSFPFTSTTEGLPTEEQSRTTKL